MSIAIVKRFPCQEEAAVAVSALWGADIPAFLFDTYYGRLWWTQQLVLGGYRVAVPTSLRDEALAVLRDVAPPSTPAAQMSILDEILIVAGFVLGIFYPFGLFFAALIFHARRKSRRDALADDVEATPLP